MLAGLTAGAIAAVIAALVSLPLHAPVDSAFNTATVTTAALVVGGISGLFWSRFSDRLLWFLGAMAGLFIIALIIAFAGNTVLDRMVSFMVPLAAIVVVVCALLTPQLAAFFAKPGVGLLKWSPVVAVIVALAVGIPLYSHGDAPSGDIAFPTRTAPEATATAPTEVAGCPAERVAGETAYVFGSDAYKIGAGSKITFSVEEELGRAPVRFEAVVSSACLDGVANLGGEPSTVILDLHSLESEQQYRDQYIRNTLFSDTTEAVVTVDELPDLPQSFLDGEETTGQLNGSLQIGEITTPLVFDVTARNDGDTINILGRTTFTWDQLGLTKPTARSVVYLADEVSVQVLMVAARAAP